MGKCFTSGVSTSCGCFAKENMSQVKRKHGCCDERLYAIWDSMRQRCLNQNCSAYKTYGGRNIKACDDWDDYSNFKRWAMSAGYNINAKRGECTLDRIDVNVIYSPDNCRWETMRTQSNNKRNTIYISYNGDTHSLTEWAK